MKATISQVNLGNLEFEGLLLEDGTFAIAIPQLVSLKLVPPNRSAKQLESLLGIAFQSHKVKTELNPKAVNAITLDTFEKVIFELSLKGNVKAIEISRNLIGLSLHQLYCDAFGIKFEKEERQEWLIKRAKSKQAFWFLADSISEWLERNPDISDNAKRFVFPNTFDAINLGLFGSKSSKIKAELGVADNELIRDYMNPEAIERITDVQKLAKINIIKRGMSPVEAVKNALEYLDYDLIDYHK